MTQSEFLQKEAELRNKRRETARHYMVLNRNAVQMHHEKMNQERKRFDQELVNLYNERCTLMDDILRQETRLRITFAKSQEREAMTNQTKEG